MQEPRRIKRSKDKVVAGVCAGFAKYFNIDPLVIRIAYVILSIASVGFPGILAYIILWIVIPEEY